MRKECGPQVVTRAEATGWAPELWATLAANGLTRVGVEGTLAEAACVVRTAARFAAPVPLADTVLAGWLLKDLPGDGPFAVAARGRAAYARFATGLVTETGLVTDFTVEPAVSMAGEPWDRVKPGGPDQPPLLGALMRSVQMAGALETVLELSVSYAQERQQFGSSLNRFQFIQGHLADLAGEVALAGAAVDLAIASPDEFSIAAARVRCGEAVTAGTALAHQIHGAIGFTDEHQLHHFTRRLWSWRDEFGTESEWAIRLGRQVAGMGAGLWAGLTTSPVQ